MLLTMSSMLSVGITAVCSGPHMRTTRTVRGTLSARMGASLALEGPYFGTAFKTSAKLNVLSGNLKRMIASIVHTFRLVHLPLPIAPLPLQMVPDYFRLWHAACQGSHGATPQLRDQPPPRSRSDLL